MTVKDYTILARVIKRGITKAIDPAYAGALEDLIEDLCKEFKQDDPRFDADHFNRECTP